MATPIDAGNDGLACRPYGVYLAHIIDGRVEHALLLELLTGEGVGTMIR